MRIVTSGSAFIDIDAYGGCMAYAELLQKQGYEAQAVSMAPPNESVTETVRSWTAGLATTYKPNTDDTFVLIDVSDPKFFDKFVDPARVEEVIDHHTGFEKYWQERVGENARIEFIGAACTLVYEQWEATQRLDEISRTSARLLLTGILDNTLNFRAHVTTERDHQAYEALRVKAALPDDWPTQYFSECQQSIEQRLETAIKHDLKYLEANSRTPEVIGQLVIWDATKLMADRREEIIKIMDTLSNDWVVNVVSIGEGKNYLLAENPDTQTKIQTVLGVEFANGVAQLDRLWLRKEILKAAQK